MAIQWNVSPFTRCLYLLYERKKKFDDPAPSPFKCSIGSEAKFVNLYINIKEKSRLCIYIAAQKLTLVLIIFKFSLNICTPKLSETLSNLASCVYIYIHVDIHLIVPNKLNSLYPSIQRHWKVCIQISKDTESLNSDIQRHWKVCIQISKDTEKSVLRYLKTLKVCIQISKDTEKCVFRYPKTLTSLYSDI